MLAFPLHPRYARMLLAAQEFGCVHQACLVAALTQGRDLLLRNLLRPVETPGWIAITTYSLSFRMICRHRDRSSDSGTLPWWARALLSTYSFTGPASFTGACR